jgi:hypothetical protein
MSSHLRSFTSFAVFFLSTSLAFWPIVLLLIGLFGIVPVLFYWESDILMNLEMLINGVHLPEEDWMLIFLIPAFILGLPMLLSHYGGELMDSQVEVYQRLTDFVFTPYGLLGWLLTIALMGTIFMGALWCARQVTAVSETAAGQYLAVITLVLGGVVFYI